MYIAPFSWLKSAYEQDQPKLTPVIKDLKGTICLECAFLINFQYGTFFLPCVILLFTQISQLVRISKQLKIPKKHTYVILEEGMRHILDLKKTSTIATHSQFILNQYFLLQISLDSFMKYNLLSTQIIIIKRDFRD